MKIIFSYVTNHNAPQQSSVQLAALSNFLAQYHGYETVFWGDKESLYKFRNIKYNDFKEFNSKELLELPPSLWSMSKLLAIRNTYEPFLHFDCDILLFVCAKYIFNKQDDILCLYNESHSDFNKLQEIYKIKPKECNNFPVISYNCGIFGGYDYKSFHIAIDIIFKFIKDNYKYLEWVGQQSNHKLYNLFFPPVLVEQIWLFQILKSFNKRIIEMGKPFFNFPENQKYIKKDKFRYFGLIHLMANKNLHSKIIKDFLDKENISY